MGKGSCHQVLRPELNFQNPSGGRETLTSTLNLHSRVNDAHVRIQNKQTTNKQINKCKKLKENKQKIKRKISQHRAGTYQEGLSPELSCHSRRPCRSPSQDPVERRKTSSAPCSKTLFCGSQRWWGSLCPSEP